MLTFAASPRWSRCPASTEPVPDDLPREPESEIVRESRAAQWSIRAFLHGDASLPEEIVGRESVTPDIAASAWAYANAVQFKGVVQPRLQEMQTTFGHTITGGSDVDLAVSEDGVLHACRFSWGWRWIDPRQDFRLLLAASAAYDPARHCHVDLHIYQPRIVHLGGAWRTRTLQHGDVQTVQAEVALAAQQATHERFARVNDECKYCALRSRCETLAETNYAALDYIERRGVGRRMTGDELGAELRNARRMKAKIEAWVTGLEAEAEARIRSGSEIVRGFHLRERQGNLYIDAEPGAFRLMTGYDLMREPVRKSPRELKKEGANADVVDKLTRRGPGRLELKELNMNQVKRMFKK